MDPAEDFAARAEAYRRELRVHCYRLTGSFDEAEDLVQETLLRAWRSRDQLEDEAGLRAWLYKIATNTCLDFLRRLERRPRAYAPVPGMDHGNGPAPDFLEWLQPFPDTLLAPGRPDEETVARETIELVFLTAIQHLTSQQRAVFVFRDVLGWSAADTAAAMGMSVASVNSALQRAKPSLRRHLPEDRSQWRTEGPTPEERKVLDAYFAASQSADLVRDRRPAHQRRGADHAAEPVLVHLPRRHMMTFVRQSLGPGVAAGTSGSGSTCPPWPTGCPRSRRTCAARAPRSSVPRALTFFACGTERSPRSPPSSRTCSWRSGCRW